MRNPCRTTVVLLAGALAMTMGSARAAEADPFVVRFGGPYQTEVSPGFRKSLLEYESGIRAAFASLGTEGLKDKEGYADFQKGFISPALAKLDPKNEAEKQLKAAAVQVNDAMSFVVDPASVPEAQRKATAGLIDVCTLPGEEPTEANKIGGLLIRFSIFGMGKDFAESIELIKRTEKGKK